MNLLIAGHSAFDTVISGETKRYAPGGIYYNVIGITGCSTSEDIISILTGIDDKYAFFAPLYENIERKLSPDIAAGVRVELTLHPDKEREEKYLVMPEPLSIRDVSDFSKFDGILFNFISGADFKLEDLLRLRAGYSGIIYADLHTLTRAMDETGLRYFRKIPDREKWLSCFHVIQVNETEFQTLSDKRDTFEAARDILQFGSKVLIVTYGKKGAAVYTIENNELEYSFISVKKISEKGCVGCGDIFGAFFFYYYVLGENKSDALKKGIKAAEMFASFDPEDTLDSKINRLKEL